MFKFLNLLVTVFIFYYYFESVKAFNAGYQVALETGNYAAMLYNGLDILIYTFWLIAIYIVVFGSAELYVTTQVVAQNEEEY